MKNILFILLLFPALCFSQISGGINGKMSGCIQPSISIKKKLISGEIYGDYFVDVDNGNDENSGTETDEAWQNISKVVTEFGNGTFGAGDTIVFKTGCTWAIDNVFEITGSSGESGNPVVLDGGSWGDGANAIIKSNSDGGSAPKYNSLCRVVACDYITIQNMTFDCDSTKRHGVVIGGTTSYGPTAQNDERFITIQDCKILDCGVTGGGDYHIAFLNQSWNNDIYNTTFQRNYVDFHSSAGICFYNGRTDLGSNVTTDYNSYVGYDTVTNTGVSGGVASAIIFKGQFDSAIVENCYVSQGTYGDAPGISFEVDTTLHQLKMHCRYNEVRMNDEQTLRLTGMHYGDLDTTGVLDIDIYYNLFIADTSMSSQGSVRIVSFEYNANSEMNFFNNTITFNDGWGGAYLSCPTGELITFRNNAVRGDGYLLGWGPGTTDITHDHNSYYNSKSGDPGYCIDEGAVIAKSNISTWEPTATTGDILFVVEFTDLHLQVGSPCINAGVNISSIPQFDFEGTAVADPPEIGAYEK